MITATSNTAAVIMNRTDESSSSIYIPLLIDPITAMPSNAP